MFGGAAVFEENKPKLERAITLKEKVPLDYLQEGVLLLAQGGPHPYLNEKETIVIPQSYATAVQNLDSRGNHYRFDKSALRSMPCPQIRNWRLADHPDRGQLVHLRKLLLFLRYDQPREQLHIDRQFVRTSSCRLSCRSIL